MQAAAGAAPAEAMAETESVTRPRPSPQRCGGSGVAAQAVPGGVGLQLQQPPHTRRRPQHQPLHAARGGESPTPACGPCACRQPPRPNPRPRKQQLTCGHGRAQRRRGHPSGTCDGPRARDQPPPPLQARSGGGASRRAGSLFRLCPHPPQSCSQVRLRRAVGRATLPAHACRAVDRAPQTPQQLQLPQHRAGEGLAASHRQRLGQTAARPPQSCGAARLRLGSRLRLLH